MIRYRDILQYFSRVLFFFIASFVDPGNNASLSGTIDPVKSWQKVYCYGYAPYTTRRITTNMAAAASEANVSRYPSEKSVKEALDMLKPPGILSKVGFAKI